MVRTANVVRFGDFEVDLPAGRLKRRGHAIRLRPQSFDVLAVLLERAGEVVTREELRHRLWPAGVFVDFELNLNCAVARLRAALNDPAARPRYIETLPKRGYRFLAVAQESRPALAVLPFVNLNGDQRLDYFADGFTEALITELGGISSLRVISRQSVLHLKGTSLTLDEIAKKLNVNVFLEGSVFHQGPRIRINAQLIRMHPERHVWARAYERDLRRSIEAQRELAGAVGEAVGGQLRMHPEGRPARGVKPEAYEAYLKASYALRLLSPEGYRNALRLLEFSIELDPDFAQGYAGLANCLAMASFMGQLPPGQGYGRAKPLARRALELDERLSLARATLGLVEFAHGWDADIAESEARRALEINPSDYEARFVLANVLLALRRRPAEALAEGRVMLDLDPLTAAARIFNAWLNVWSADYQQAVRWAEEAIEMRADLPMAWNALGMARLALGQPEPALSAFERAVALARDPVYVAFVGNVKARLGAMDEARALRDEVMERSRQGYVPPKALAILDAGLGEVDRAVEALELLYEQRDGYLFYVPLVPLYDPLREDQRFRRLMRRVGGVSRADGR
jgi:TolB-like protein/Tfp pilus assembly protein PilF